MILPKTPSFRLDKKRALVIGASSGIGMGSAVALAEAGAEVFLAARRKNILIDLKTQLIAKGYKSEILELDITNIKKLRNIIDNQPAFDILINSAGLAKHFQAKHHPGLCKHLQATHRSVQASTNMSSAMIQHHH